jgi:hypothetical protein
MPESNLAESKETKSSEYKNPKLKGENNADCNLLERIGELQTTLALRRTIHNVLQLLVTANIVLGSLIFHIDD